MGELMRKATSTQKLVHWDVFSKKKSRNEDLKCGVRKNVWKFCL